MAVSNPSERSHEASGQRQAAHFALHKNRYAQPSRWPAASASSRLCAPSCRYCPRWPRPSARSPSGAPPAPLLPLVGLLAAGAPSPLSSVPAGADTVRSAQGEDPVDGDHAVHLPRLLPDPALRHPGHQVGRPFLLDARHPRLQPRHADGAGHLADHHVRHGHAAPGGLQDHRGRQRPQGGPHALPGRPEALWHHHHHRPGRRLRRIRHVRPGV